MVQQAGPRRVGGTITATTANRGVLNLSRRLQRSIHGAPSRRHLTFTATSPQYEGGKGTCRATGPVTVREGVKTTVTVECQVK